MDLTELTQWQQAAVADAPELYRASLSRALGGSASPRGAIKAFCLQCTGFVRSDITKCSARACALYAYRPYQDDREGNDSEHGHPEARDAA